MKLVKPPRPGIYFSFFLLYVLFRDRQEMPGPFIRRVNGENSAQVKSGFFPVSFLPPYYRRVVITVGIFRINLGNPGVAVQSFLLFANLFVNNAEVQERRRFIGINSINFFVKSFGLSVPVPAETIKGSGKKFSFYISLYPRDITPFQMAVAPVRQRVSRIQRREIRIYRRQSV